MHMFPFKREGSEEIMWPAIVNTYWILSAIITPKIELNPGIIQIYSFQWTWKQSMKVKQSQRTWSVLIRWSIFENIVILLIRWSISEKYCDIYVFSAWGSSLQKHVLVYVFFPLKQDQYLDLVNLCKIIKGSYLFNL